MNTTLQILFNILRRFSLQFILIFLSLLSLVSLTSCIEGGKKAGKRAYVQIGADDFVDDEEPPPTPVKTRPTKDITVRSDFCACLAGKSDINNACTSFCATPEGQVTQSTLFGTVDLGPTTSVDPALGNLHNWCSVEYNDVSPRCFLRVQKEDLSTLDLNVTTIKGSNKFSAVIQSDLNYNTVYLAKIVAVSSALDGTGVIESETSSFQILRRRATSSDSIGNLKVSNMSAYTCLIRSFDTQGNIGVVARFHFYFPINNRPAIVPSGVKNVLCHDTGTSNNEVADNMRYDRLEEIQSHFSLWNKSDSRFQKSSDSTSAPFQIEQDIKTQIFNRFGTDYTGTNLFRSFTWPTGFDFSKTTGDNQDASAQQKNFSGIIMSPFLNTSTGLPFCPTQTDYMKTDQPLFQVLKDYIGTDTEGLFLGVNEQRVSRNDGSQQTIPDLLFVRENELKLIGFYFENGLEVPVDSFAMTQKTIHFYWPPNANYENPYFQGNRRLFTIRHPNELEDTTNEAYIMPDKRFGCIPSEGIPKNF